MPCEFSTVENACGCTIGYTEPLKTLGGAADITSYPVDVLNVNGDVLGTANSPSEYVALWNSDVDDQAKGVLYVGTGAYCFYFIPATGITPINYVMGTAGSAPPPDTFSFYYGATDLDTTGAEPSEAAYIASVDAVFTAVAELTGGPLTTGSNVQANSFGNLTDKVLFIQVPSTETAFDKWSEVGNLLQQNLGIDPTYGSGLNVWFKSTRGGNTIYLTRSQTSFTGAVVLSR